LADTLHNLANQTEQKLCSVLAFSKDARKRPGLGPLTARETELTVFLCDGMTIADAAGKMGISPETAETHKFSVYRKLSITKASQLGVAAIRHGIIPCPCLEHRGAYAAA